METHNFNFNAAHIRRVDYKDVDLLKKFLNAHGRILPKRKMNTSASNQKKIAQAIKQARYMGLLPYVSK